MIVITKSFREPIAVPRETKTFLAKGLIHRKYRSYRFDIVTSFLQDDASTYSGIVLVYCNILI